MTLLPIFISPFCDMCGYCMCWACNHIMFQYSCHCGSRYPDLVSHFYFACLWCFVEPVAVSYFNAAVMFIFFWMAMHLQAKRLFEIGVQTGYIITILTDDAGMLSMTLLIGLDLQVSRLPCFWWLKVAGKKLNCSIHIGICEAKSSTWMLHHTLWYQ